MKETKQISKISMILISSILVEAIVSYLKIFFIDGKFHFQIIYSLLLGLTFVFLYDLDLPYILGFKKKPHFFGYFITSILISRGSNYLFDTVKKISEDLALKILN